MTVPSHLNIHSEYIDKKIDEIRKDNKWWRTKIVDTTHEEFINDFSTSVFTNLIQRKFSKKYVQSFACGGEESCEDIPTQRCHGIGDERPILIRRALQRVWKDTTKPIALKEIVIAFLEEHKNTKFTFKCKACHLKEKKLS